MPLPDCGWISSAPAGAPEPSSDPLHAADAASDSAPFAEPATHIRAAAGFGSARIASRRAARLSVVSKVSVRVSLSANLAIGSVATGPVALGVAAGAVVETGDGRS